MPINVGMPPKVCRSKEYEILVLAAMVLSNRVNSSWMMRMPIPELMM